ncbi:MAG: hypothetical protein JO002_18195 [Burkholderiaceae bacterium]|nr:hypothetical protein [Burkholderiaceae bacterium]
MLSTKNYSLALLCAWVLAGCGGGGDDVAFCGYDAYGNAVFCGTTNPPSPPTPVASTDTFPVPQALLNVATQSYSYSVSAYDRFGNQFTIQYASAPGAAGTYNGQAASTANVTESFYENGALQETDTFVNYFVLSPYQFLGSVGNFAGGVEVVNSFQTLPATATVGQSFPELSATLYHDTTQTVSDGTLTEAIGLSADTASTALFCFNDTTQLTQTGMSDNLVNGNSSTCFRIDTSGNVQGMQITTPVNGTSMLFF